MYHVSIFVIQQEFASMDELLRCIPMNKVRDECIGVMSEGTDRRGCHIMNCTSIGKSGGGR